MGRPFEFPLFRPALFLLLIFQPFVLALSDFDQQYQKLAQKEGAERLEGLLALAEACLRTEPQKGQACAEEARALAQKLKRPGEEAMAIHWLALYLDAKGDFSMALQCAESGLQRAESLSDPKPLIRVLLTMSVVLDHMGSYDRALEVAERAFRLAEGLDDARLIANSHMTFGLSLFRLHQFERAREYYKKAREMMQALKDIKGEARAVNALAYLETMREPPNHRGALVLFEEALALQRQNGDIKSQSDYLLNMGISHFGLKAYPKAEACYQESLALRKRLGDKLAVAMVQHNLALLFIETGRREEGHRLLTEAMTAYGEMGARHHLAGALRQEAMYFKDNGEFKEALKRFETFMEITEALLKADTAQKLADAEARHQTEQKQRQIEILKKDVAVRRARGRLYGLGLLALAVTALLLYNRYRLKAKTSRVISQANRELETLDAIVKAINGTGDLSSLLQALLQNAWLLFPQADRLAILLLDPDLEVFCTEAALSRREEEREITLGVVLTVEEARLRYTQGRELAEGIYLIQDVGALLSRKGLVEAVCLLVMCIEIEGQRLGYLVLDHVSDPKAFLEADAIRLSRLRQHAVSALAKARNLARLQELNDQKDAFLGMAAHDLRHPLNGMVLNAQLAQEDPDPEMLKSRLQHIQKEGLSMSQIIGRFLDVAAVEAGKLHVECLPFRLDELAKRQLQGHQPAADAKKIRLEAVFPEHPVAALGDERLMMEVLDNLISNAIKFSPSARAVSLNVLTGHQKAVIRVEDQGPGLTDEDKKRIFGRFAKLSAKPTAGEKSIGLGLSIVKHMVDAMKGRIWVESEWGAGAVFGVELPLFDGGLGEVEGFASSKEIDLKGLSILLAEDDRQHRLMACTLLERRGAQVEAVEDGVRVLEVLEHKNFDWVLLDGHMPRLDGPGTVQEIRRRESEGPWQTRRQKIVALTGSIEASELQMEQGYDGYLPKPLDLEAFGRMIGKGQVVRAKDEGGLWDRLAQAMGGVGPFREFLAVCRDDFEFRMENMKFARLKFDRAELCRQAHDLKSSAASLSFMELSEVAKNLEMHGLTLEWNELDQSLEVIEKLYLKALEQIRAYLG